MKNKTNKVLFVILSIFLFVFGQSIVYGAFSSTFNVTGRAFTRVETDVRVTDFYVKEVVNANSQYAEFGKDNDAKTGSKGDFIFRDYDDEGNEIGDEEFFFEHSDDVLEEEITKIIYKNEQKHTYWLYTDGACRLRIWSLRKLQSWHSSRRDAHPRLYQRRQLRQRS